MFLVRLVFLPVKVGTKATTVAAKTGYRTGRMLGYKRLFVFGLGVVIGLLIAPGPGRELREKLKAMFEGGDAPSASGADHVHYEAAATRPTTDLPQPAGISGTNGHN